MEAFAFFDRENSARKFILLPNVKDEPRRANYHWVSIAGKAIEQPPVAALALATCSAFLGKHSLRPQEKTWENHKDGDGAIQSKSFRATTHLFRRNRTPS
jgi:hypothetical protein